MSQQDDRKWAQFWEIMARLYEKERLERLGGTEAKFAPKTGVSTAKEGEIASTRAATKHEPRDAILPTEKGNTVTKSYCVDDELTHVASKDVEVVDTAWVLQDFIPVGHLVLLAGEPGVGKSTLTATLAAQYSWGGWGGKAGKVFVASLEEDAAHVLKPRVLAAGAFESRIFYRNEDEEPMQFPRDLRRLSKYLAKYRPGLMILDSAQELIPHLGGNTVRPILHALKDMARVHGCTIVLICHYNRTGTSIQTALYGSSGFYQSARIVLQFGKIPDSYSGAREPGIEF